MVSPSSLVERILFLKILSPAGFALGPGQVTGAQDIGTLSQQELAERGGLRLSPASLTFTLISGKI